VIGHRRILSRNLADEDGCAGRGRGAAGRCRAGWRSRSASSSPL